MENLADFDEVLTEAGRFEFDEASGQLEIYEVRNGYGLHNRSNLAITVQ